MDIVVKEFQFHSGSKACFIAESNYVDQFLGWGMYNIYIQSTFYLDEIMCLKFLIHEVCKLLYHLEWGQSLHGLHSLIEMTGSGRD